MEKGKQTLIIINIFRNVRKNSTQELQRSHYNFGSGENHWTTTSQANFCP